ncbi:MAG: winged helix-turn-helix transcriptional regulator [Candidatus Thorarchaeota archaeon]
MQKMRELDREQKSQVLKAWREASQTIKKRFGIRPPAAPIGIYVSIPDDEKEKYQPGIIEDDSIIINSNIPDYEDVLNATITKLCFQRGLPSDLLCRECIDDLSFEFARQTITDDRVRCQWESVWSKYSQPQKLSQVVEYYPSEAYIWLYSVAGERGLDTFIHELTQRARNQLPLYFEEYVHYFSVRGRRFENTLNSTELRLVRSIIERPDLQVKQLSEMSGISEEWVSRKLSQLQKQGIIKKFNRAPFSRIGIHMYHVLVSKKETDIDPFTLFKNCPFLYSYRRVVAGDWTALATLSVPENRESIRFLKEGLKRIAQVGFDLDLHKIYSSGISHCFDYYEPKRGQWNIPWELLTIHLRRIKSDGLASSMPRIDRPEKRTKIELDDLDMKIFECIREGVASVSKIRQQLKVGQHRVAEKLPRLRVHGLVIRSWDVRNIGLNEHVIIYCNDKDMGKTIAAWSLRLPRSIISFSSNEELMLIADLPRGGSFGLATALEGLNNGTCIGILSPQTYGSWGFPSELWDSKFQKWKCPKKELESWITQIG